MIVDSNRAYTDINIKKHKWKSAGKLDKWRYIAQYYLYLNTLCKILKYFLQTLQILSLHDNLYVRKMFIRCNQQVK